MARLVQGLEVIGSTDGQEAHAPRSSPRPGARVGARDGQQAAAEALPDGCGRGDEKARLVLDLIRHEPPGSRIDDVDLLAR